MVACAATGSGRIHQDDNRDSYDCLWLARGQYSGVPESIQLSSLHLVHLVRHNRHVEHLRLVLVPPITRDYQPLHP
jgi:hypothetical protein